jgi:hypothetical protein
MASWPICPAGIKFERGHAAPQRLGGGFLGLGAERLLAAPGRVAQQCPREALFTFYDDYTALEKNFNGILFAYDGMVIEM